MGSSIYFADVTRRLLILGYLLDVVHDLSSVRSVQNLAQGYCSQYGKDVLLQASSGDRFTGISISKLWPAGFPPRVRRPCDAGANDNRLASNGFRSHNVSPIFPRTGLPWLRLKSAWHRMTF
jgi:hypothetical protein